MGSAIIAEVPLVDCRASVEVVFLHITHRKTGDRLVLHLQRIALKLRRAGERVVIP